MTLQRKKVHGMKPNELAALNDWASTMRKARPLLNQTTVSARKISEAMIGEPVWRVAEGEPEHGHQRPVEMKDPMRIGPPKVNYVDHIDRIGDSHESPIDEGNKS